MVRNTKLLAILLAAMMVMAQAPLALAGVNPLQAAVEAGREVSFEEKVVWYGIPFLDEATNSTIASVLNTMKFAGRSGTAGDAAYAAIALYLQDQPAANFDFVVQGDGLYANSNFLPRPIAVEAEDVAVLAERFSPLAEEALGFPVSMLESAVESSMGQMAGSLSMLEGIMAPMAESLAEPVMAWAEAALAGELYEGALESAFGVGVASAMLTGVTFEDMLDLLDIVLPPILENDAYWAFIIEQMKPIMGMMGQEMPADNDELLAAMKESLGQVTAALPALREQGIEAYLYYAECYDAAGDVVTNQVKFFMPSEDTPIDFLVEWLPDGENYLARFLIGANGLTLKISAPAPVVAAGGTSREFNVNLSLLKDGEAAGEFALAVTCKTAEEGGKSTSEGLVRLTTAGMLSPDAMGVEVGWKVATEAAGEDAKLNAKIDIAFLAGEASVPMVSFECAAATGEPQGLPFEIEGTEFFHIAKASEEELTAFVEEELQVTAMQAAFQILALLPEEVMTMVMGDMGGAAE